MNLRIILSIFAISFIFTSCFKEDDMIEPHKPGNTEMQTIAMGQYYTNQAYFDLSTNSAVKTNLKDIYDLAFHCTDSILLIRLNTAKFMRATATGDTAFYSISDTTGREWTYDVASGNPDSIAIKGWFSINGNDTNFSQEVFIIDRGISALGIVQGVRKIRITNYSKDSYFIEYANLDNSNFHKIEVTKEANRNYVQLNLNAGEQQLNLEPNRNDWDIFFTQYTDILTTDQGEKYPYLVTGVLLNPNNIVVAVDSITKFEDITIDDILGYEFKSTQNTIGYDWKWYDFDAGYYTVRTWAIFIIQDVEGYYYKLRFTGFYSLTGEKGYPQFEFQRL